MLAQGGQSTDLVMLGEGGGREDPQVWCCSGRGVDETHRSDAIQGGGGGLSSPELRAGHLEVLMIYGVGSSRGRGEGKTTPRSDDVKGQMGSKEKGGIQ